MKVKLEKISKIILDTENHIEKTVKKKVKAARTQLKIKNKEVDEIKQAGVAYDSYSFGLRSAMPMTEAERLKDMNELKTAISMLESFDEDSYIEKKVIDAGLGMFYDKMSQRFTKIINDNKFNAYTIIPAQRLMYHVFLNVKNITEQDILPILNVMKDTKLLNDIVEINSTFFIVIFTDEKLNFTLPEKVILSFAYDKDLLSIQNLMELTDWKIDYAKRIIEGLEAKINISITDNNLEIEGFSNSEGRRKWDEIIQEKIQEQKEKEESKRRQQFERKRQLQTRLTQIETVEMPEDEPTKSDSEIQSEPIQFGTKPMVKTLPTPKTDDEPKIEVKGIKSKETQEIIDKDDLLSAMDALDEIMPGQPKIEMEDLGEHEVDLEDLIPEKILNYHEKFTLITGGLTQYEKIKIYLEQDIPGKDIPDDLLKNMLEQLKELQMIQNSLKIGNYQFYLFKDTELNNNEKDFIEFAINKEPLKKEDFIEGLNLSEEDILVIMKNLQEKGILKIETNNIIIPGIIQKE